MESTNIENLFHQEASTTQKMFEPSPYIPSFCSDEGGNMEKTPSIPPT